MALDASRKVLAILSSHYLQSQMAVEEYNIAVLRDRQDRTRVLFPVIVESAPLPGYMRARQLVDCSLRDRRKLESMCQVLLDDLDSSAP